VKPIVVHPEAEAEYHFEFDFLESRQLGLGVSFREQIEAAIGRIRDNPASYAIHEDYHCRECIVMKFPYSIYYVEFGNFIWVVAFAHQKREPGYSLGRLR
jgi:toxin ParE1/3/4